jgi:mono/diheme cytochrome c family protein
MLRRSLLAALLILAGNAATAGTQSSPGATRGELLYSAHCITCHSAQVHWRDKKLVTDWASLQTEVRRWQGAAGLGWNDRNIAGVTRHLNTLYYHYPKPD